MINQLYIFEVQPTVLTNSNIFRYLFYDTLTTAQRQAANSVHRHKRHCPSSFQADPMVPMFFIRTQHVPDFAKSVLGNLFQVVYSAFIISPAIASKE